MTFSAAVLLLVSVWTKRHQDSSFLGKLLHGPGNRLWQVPVHGTSFAINLRI